ncbi:helix-turn-helix domain-containing protein [Rhodococcus hoagii]|nr:helix-turn-helix domain-containing protein [Prescottella equi]
MISVLSAFSGSEALTSSRIAHRTGLPRSSVHRLLQRLVELGVIRRDGFDYGWGSSSSSSAVSLSPNTRSIRSRCPTCRGSAARPG